VGRGRTFAKLFLDPHSALDRRRGGSKLNCKTWICSFKQSYVGGTGNYEKNQHGLACFGRIACKAQSSGVDGIPSKFNLEFFEMLSIIKRSEEETG
jgi:hypothetical protein